MNATGQCLCGAVSFSAEDVETDYHACHCGTCRQWSGGPLLAVRVGKVKFTGEDQIQRYTSSAWAQRGFCARCGSNLFYHLNATDQYIMAVGVFDDQSPFKLTGEIYVDEKPASYSFAGDHSRLTGDEFMAALKSGEL